MALARTDPEEYERQMNQLNADKINKGVKPIQAGDAFGVEWICPSCKFPEGETLLMDMRFCYNCGAKLDWSDWENLK